MDWNQLDNKLKKKLDGQYMCCDERSDLKATAKVYAI
jgi:hypothetical protein